MRHSMVVRSVGAALAVMALRCTDESVGHELDGAGTTAGRGGGGNAASPDSGALATAGTAGGAAGTSQPSTVETAGSSAAGTASAPPPDDGLPTWTGVYTYTMWSCKNASCHGKGVAGIDMTSQQAAYDSLVNQPASTERECSMVGKVRVVPNDPDNSLLYLKLDLNPPCGQQMPPGGQVPQKSRDRIRDWIAQGAKND